MEKDATIITNDPRLPQQRLTISGQVDLFARINPRTLYLRGAVGQNLRATARIQPQEKYPFRILNASVDNSHFKVFLREELKQGINNYLVDVEAIDPKPGVLDAQIRLQTDSPFKPEITIRVIVQATVG